MSLALRQLMRPLMSELEHPLARRSGLFFPTFADFARDMGPLMSRPTSFNVRETDKEVVVEAETPGYSRDNLSVAVEGTRLIIKGQEQKEEEGSDMYERAEFTQAFELPQNLVNGKIAANYKDGILRVTLTKPEPEKVQVMNVPIEDTTSGGYMPISENKDAQGTTDAQS